jgi:hypothetical protein
VYDVCARLCVCDTTSTTVFVQCTSLVKSVVKYAYEEDWEEGKTTDERKKQVAARMCTTDTKAENYLASRRSKAGVCRTSISM